MKAKYICAMGAILFMVLPLTAHADEAFLESLKDKYQLNDAQVEDLQRSGLSDPQLAIVSRLAKKSEKSIEEVLKLKSESKMGWGEIATQLKVSPNEVGLAITEMHRQNWQERHPIERTARHKVDP